MYAMALKTLKDQFGQASVIAWAVVNKLTKGEKIARNTRQALWEFFLDVINCLVIVQCLNFCADVNASESLHRIIMRLPDNLIEKWKQVVTDIREREAKFQPYNTSVTS